MATPEAAHTEAEHKRLGISRIVACSPELGNRRPISFALACRNDGNPLQPKAAGAPQNCLDKVIPKRAGEPPTGAWARDWEGGSPTLSNCAKVDAP